MSQLTELEKEMHQRLHEQGSIEWAATSNQQTQALNRLVKKGYATYDGVKREWGPMIGD